MRQPCHICLSGSLRSGVWPTVSCLLVTWLYGWCAHSTNGSLLPGTALGGSFLPLILPPLINAHGIYLTLRYLSVALLVALAPVIPFVKPRLPQGRVRGPARRGDTKTWLRDWRWWSLLTMNTMQGFAYFVPVFWLPSEWSAPVLTPNSFLDSICLCA